MTKQVPLRCVKCDEPIPLEDEVVLDPETGEPTMGGDAYHPGCAPSQVTPKMLTITRKALEKLNFDWEVRQDEYDPNYPGIVVETTSPLFATIGEDGEWMIMAASVPPHPPQEIEDGKADYWWVAIEQAVGRLLHYTFSDKVNYVIYHNENLRPEGF